MCNEHSDIYKIVRRVINERLINFQNPIKMYGNTMKSMFFRRRKSTHDNSRRTINNEITKENETNDHH